MTDPRDVVFLPDFPGALEAIHRKLAAQISRQIDRLIELAPHPIVTATELALCLAHDLTPWGTIRLAKEIK